MSKNKSISYLSCNKGIIVNLYKLYFLFSHFSFQSIKRVFHHYTFSPFQPNTLLPFQPNTRRKNQILRIIYKKKKSKTEKCGSLVGLSEFGLIMTMMGQTE